MNWEIQGNPTWLDCVVMTPGGLSRITVQASEILWFRSLNESDTDYTPEDSQTLLMFKNEQTLIVYHSEEKIKELLGFKNV